MNILLRGDANDVLKRLDNGIPIPVSLTENKSRVC
jgi:hypothetical protein